MNTQMTEHPRDWDAQRERLSASLDGRLGDAERAELERHVAGCARCTAELAALRRTVALLRALPAPALPRSFALPVPQEGPGGADASGGADGAARERPATLPVAGGVAARAGRHWAAAVQWAGSVAAGIGVLLLLGSALAGYGSHPFAATNSAGSYSAAPAHASAAADQGSATTTAHQPASATITAPTAAPTAPGDEQTPGAVGASGAPTPTAAGGSASAGPVSTPMPFTSPYEETGTPPPPTAVLAGAGLLLGGLAALVVGRRARRRAG